MKISELWLQGQSNQLQLSKPIIPPSLEAVVDTQPFLPYREALNEYMEGHFIDCLQHLIQDASFEAMLLKVLCCLQLALQDQTVAGLTARDYLKEKYLPLLEQTPFVDSNGTIHQSLAWLRQYCYGYALPHEAFL